MFLKPILLKSLNAFYFKILKYFDKSNKWYFSLWSQNYNKFNNCLFSFILDYNYKILSITNILIN